MKKVRISQVLMIALMFSGRVMAMPIPGVNPPVATSVVEDVLNYDCYSSSNKSGAVPAHLAGNEKFAIDDFGNLTASPDLIFSNDSVAVLTVIRPGSVAQGSFINVSYMLSPKEDDRTQRVMSSNFSFPSNVPYGKNFTVNGIFLLDGTAYFGWCTLKVTQQTTVIMTPITADILGTADVLLE